MQHRPEQESPDNPLRRLTPAQFMALGGNAVVFIRRIKGEDLAQFLPDNEFGEDEDLQLVMSGDGSPLLVADTELAVDEWLADKNFGIVALH